MIAHGSLGQLPVLAVSAMAGHQLGLSPALGALSEGVLLAVSPFATHMRADAIVIVG